MEQPSKEEAREVLNKLNSSKLDVRELFWKLAKSATMFSGFEEELKFLVDELTNRDPDLLLKFISDIEEVLGILRKTDSH